MAKKSTVKHTFGKSAEVVVVNPDSDHFDTIGTIETGILNKDDQYAILIPTGDVIWVHANDLDLSDEAKRTYVIKEASIKDDFCNYTFSISKGIGLGDDHNVKGKGIIDEDLRHAFGKFNVHLACIDDAFKLSGIEIDDIETMHSHELTSNYLVTGFKIIGEEDNQQIILMGNKRVSYASSRIPITSPKIALDTMASYKHYNELKQSADVACKEVGLYKEGKCIIPEIDDSKSSVQLTISHQLKDGEPVVNEEDHSEDFETAKV